MRWNTPQRIARLDLAIEEAVKLTPPKMRAVIEALQALRGVAQVTAVTIVAEVGEVSRFPRARQLMGNGGIVASEHSSGESNWRGGITKTGMRTYGEWSWRQPGHTATDPISVKLYGSDKKWSAKKSARSPGKRSIGCIRAIGS
jgi:transposase